MPRSGAIKKRVVQEDPVYKSKVLAKLVNRAMRSGKKGAAQKQIYRSLKMVKTKTNQDPLMVFNKALENIKPLMEVRPRRVGGAAYQVPMPVRGDRRESLAIRWLIKAAASRPSREFHTFAEKLTAEILDAFNNTGGAVKKKDDTHRMAEANKTFAHFRW
jgi:small subunit ribosomal protein S7